MTDNHYTTLGVEPDADTDTIKRAYRKAAKEHHPDKGGDPEAFAAIGNAWLVLRDPDKRERYDRGESEPVDDAFARVSHMLCAVFAGLMDQVDIDYTDMVGEVRKNLIEMKKRCAAQSDQIDKAIAKALKALGRLKYTGERGDVIVTMLNGAVDQHRKTKDAQIKESETIDAALAYLTDYSYQADQRPGGYGGMPWTMNTNGSTGSW